MPSMNSICNMDINYGEKTQSQVLQNIEKIQNKALRIMNFKNSWKPSEEMYKESKISKRYYNHKQFEICI